VTHFSINRSVPLCTRSLNLLLIATYAFTIAGCGKGGKSGNEIRIGVVMPITGREAKPGQYQRWRRNHGEGKRKKASGEGSFL
jgi:hypothetical protein